MKKLLLLLAFVISFVFAFDADSYARGSISSRSSGSTVSVRGYTTKSGKHVSSHKRTAPNKSKSDNWSTTGNVNPYTGKAGTKNPY